MNYVSYIYIFLSIDVNFIGPNERPENFILSSINLILLIYSSSLFLPLL